VSFSYAATCMNEDSAGKEAFAEQLQPLIFFKNCFSSRTLLS